MTERTPLIVADKDNLLRCQGIWSIATVETLSHEARAIQNYAKETITFDGKSLEYFDSAGALVLRELIALLKTRGNSITLVHFTKQQEALLQLLQDKADFIHQDLVDPHAKPWMYLLGKETVHKWIQAKGFMRLVGNVCITIVEALGNWKRFRIASIISNLYSTGLQALPILALLSFLIGVVLSYQMGLQLQTYGANTFIAYLSGMAIFREFGPLITAIIVAGRTSSAFTAQIGSMKVNEEIDAIQTMGLSPIELLVIPKIIGLTLIFPILIFWSDVFSCAEVFFY